jgi:hypothetical protein
MVAPSAQRNGGTVGLLATIPVREDRVTAIWMLAEELQRFAQVRALPG